MQDLCDGFTMRKYSDISEKAEELGLRTYKKAFTNVCCSTIET